MLARKNNRGEKALNRAFKPRPRLVATSLCVSLLLFSSVPTRAGNGTEIIFAPLIPLVFKIFRPLFEEGNGPYQSTSTPADRAKNKMWNIGLQGSVVVADGLNSIYSTGAGGRSHIPASAIKVPLVLAAFKLLGEDFRFTTNFYKDRRGNLVIRGGGDPFLVSEEIDLIAKNLKKLGHTQFRNIGLDDRLFNNVKLLGTGESDNPYDARLASLLVNFNTLNVKRTRDGKIISAEKQTPTLPLMQNFESSIACCDKAERINLGGRIKNRRAYVAQLFREIFKQNGINFSKANGYVQPRINLKRKKPIYTHKNSRSLEDVSKQLLLYSNNLIANALLLQFAPDAKDPLKASLNAWRKYLASILSPTSLESLLLVEGAGLSRQNMITRDAMLNVLLDFEDYIHLLPSDGDGASYKTGTLSGISTAVGYIHRTYPYENPLAFVILGEGEDSRAKRDQLINEMKALATRAELGARKERERQ